MAQGTERSVGEDDGVPAGFSVCHAADSPFASGGLRAFFQYRDLGIREATKGRIGAHVIRAKEGTGAAPQWHRHELEFQMVYVTRGWVVFEYEGVGEVRLEAGSCVHQPPGIRHIELAHSDDLELIEITSPAEFATINVDPP
jgi:mannose-6-phosphate isomerase-like protein (cupin superfamily)